jgi:hypothetical protein
MGLDGNSVHASLCIIPSAHTPRIASKIMSPTIQLATHSIRTNRTCVRLPHLP